MQQMQPPKMLLPVVLFSALLTVLASSSSASVAQARLPEVATILNHGGLPKAQVGARALYAVRSVVFGDNPVRNVLSVIDTTTGNVASLTDIKGTYRETNTPAAYDRATGIFYFPSSPSSFETTLFAIRGTVVRPFSMLGVYYELQLDPTSGILYALAFVCGDIMRIITFDTHTNISSPLSSEIYTGGLPFVSGKPGSAYDVRTGILTFFVSNQTAGATPFSVVQYYPPRGTTRNLVAFNCPSSPLALHFDDVLLKYFVLVSPGWNKGVDLVELNNSTGLCSKPLASLPDSIQQFSWSTLDSTTGILAILSPTHLHLVYTRQGFSYKQVPLSEQLTYSWSGMQFV